MTNHPHRNIIISVLLAVALASTVIIMDGSGAEAGASTPQAESTVVNPEVRFAAANPAPPVPPVAYDNLSEEIESLARWAVALFDEADLELPPVRFTSSGGDTSICHGRPGVHQQIDGVSVITLCTTDPSSATQTMLLHETAHSWASLSLTEDHKNDFQQLRGWEHWRDYEAAEWHENGTEQAAEIMVWGLIDRPIRIVRIYQNTCNDLDAGYRALTGETPLHGFEDMCA